MTPDDPRHGTEAGHEQHIRDGEESCPACVHGDRLASRRRSKRKTMGYIYQRPIGNRLLEKIREARASGATYEDVARWAGVSESQVFRVVAAGPQQPIYARTWLKLDAMRPQQVVTTVGVTRRLRALTALGWSLNRLSVEAGVDPTTVGDALAAPPVFMSAKTKAAIAATYERLCMTPPIGASKQERAGITRARNRAAREQWAPPLAWDNIDHPNEAPDMGASVISDDIDHVAIERALAGERVQLTRAEKFAAIHVGIERGMSQTQIEQTTRIYNVARYLREERATS